MHGYGFLRKRRLRLVILALPLACSDPASPDSTGLTGTWLSLGLDDRFVRTLAVAGSRLYAGTDNGIYRASLESGAPTWIAIGLSPRPIESLLILGIDTIYATVAITGTGADTVALFRTIDAGQNWHPYQNGFGGDTESKRVLALGALPGGSTSLLATGGASVVAKSDDAGSSWRVVWGGWQLGSVGTHFIFVDSLHPGAVWVGGEGGRFQPFLLHSEDFGETWREIWLSGGDNAHYSLAVDPMDPQVVFTGMEGSVLRSVDGGYTWQPVLQPEDYPYFYGLSTSRVTRRRVYAAGSKQGLAADLRELRLYASDDAGQSWQSSAAGSVRGGVHALLVWSPPTGGEQVFVATGAGVWQFTPTQ
jgi:hypothetical protein